MTLTVPIASKVSRIKLGDSSRASWLAEPNSASWFSRALIADVGDTRLLFLGFFFDSLCFFAAFTFATCEVMSS